MRDDDVYRAVKALLVEYIPDLTADRIVRGWSNRVPAPRGGFCLMRILVHERRATNFAEYAPAAESLTLAESALVTMQLDFYGTAPASMADVWAHDFAVLWRDAMACDFLDPAGIAPTVAGNPRHLPLVGGDEQFLDRWMVEATASIFDELKLRQAFFDTVDITLYPLL